ncbi:MAG: nitric oxide reductase activation protein NorD [Anaerolineae bacterium]
MSTSTEERYRGFSLSSVSWGYRDIFAQTLEGLFDRGAIGESRPEVTDAFFSLMRCAEEQHFDYVLKEFLGALNRQTAWVLDLPAIFADVTEVGRELAQAKLHYGIRYFRVLGEGGFGRSPREVRHLMTIIKRLRAVDDDLAMAFLNGYGEFVTRLEPSEVDLYVKQGLRVYHRNNKTGLRFMEGSLKTSDVIIRSLTQEARLEDLEPSLVKLLRALVGYDVEVGDLGHLDSDELIERGTQMVCMTRWLYLPHRIRHFDRVAQNRNWYRLCGVVAAGMLALDSFSRIQGHPAYQTCADLVGSDLSRLNLFQILEYIRVLRGIHARWPGARRLLRFGVETEAEVTPPRTAAEHLFFDLTHVVVGGEVGLEPASDAGAGVTPDKAQLVERLMTVVRSSVNAFDTAELLTHDLLAHAEAAYPGLRACPLRTFAFLPDFLYPGEVRRPPNDALIADLKETAQQRQAERSGDEDEPDLQAVPGDATTDEVTEDADAEGQAAAYVYDEWSQEEGSYYRNYCYVYEEEPSPNVRQEFPSDLVDIARRTRRVFEMLRPELSKEKHLSEGDVINVDLLTKYLVEKRLEPSPRVDFYEKPYHNRRDLATLILLDVSGSTRSEVPSQTTRTETIEMEKRASLILGHGLAALDDRFAICAFSGTGREQCEFLIYKDFEAPWDRTAISNVLAAYPRSSTRIGAALRHAGYRLSSVPARQHLIILITDGKPMDTAYDPATRYAQYDVRMACEENRRQCISTFCISTDDNSRADMEIMFPEHRYVILSDIARLPHILPRLYLRLTL